MTLNASWRERWKQIWRSAQLQGQVRQGRRVWESNPRPREGRRFSGPRPRPCRALSMTPTPQRCSAVQLFGSSADRLFTAGTKGVRLYDRSTVHMLPEPPNPLQRVGAAAPFRFPRADRYPYMSSPTRSTVQVSMRLNSNPRLDSRLAVEGQARVPRAPRGAAMRGRLPLEGKLALC